MEPRGHPHVPLRTGIRSQSLSISYPISNHLAVIPIFGIYSGPIVGPAHDPNHPSHERLRGVLLDSAVPAALRDRSPTRARIAPGGAGGARRYPSGVAGIAARPARRGEAGDDGEPGDRALSRAQAVRAGPGALRRAVLPPARGARPGESGDRAGGAGTGVCGDRRIGRAIRCARGDRRSDKTRKSERGKRDRWRGATSLFRVPRSAFGVGWGRGKFVSWVAATRARPGQAVIVRPGEEGKFLASQPLSVLPLDTDTHRRLRQLGVRTLGALAALPE